MNPIVSPISNSAQEETKGTESHNPQTEQSIPIPDIVSRNDNVYPLVLACFIRFAAPFFAYVMQSTNNYHHQCMKDGVTPVRRLQMWFQFVLFIHSSRGRRKKTATLLPGLLGDKENPSSAIPYILEIDPAAQISDKTQENETAVGIVSNLHL